MFDPYSPLVRPYLSTRSLEPENQETPIQFIRNEIVNTRLFFRRNHFSYPPLTFSNFWIPVKGSVTTPLMLSMQDLYNFQSKTIKVALECSGNKRSLFEPKVFGEQWEKGAISQGIWRGVPLRTLLKLAGISENAKEVVVEGYDYGKRTDLKGVHSYTRSLPIEKALHPDTIIAYVYNHKPISFKHGYPFRLIVPQWYGMASVKWIKQITVIDNSFEGPFQSIDYVYYPNKDDNKGAYPVTIINVDSTIQKPLHMDVLDTGKHLIQGIAWTGEGYIKEIEISTDNGKTWTNVLVENEEKAPNEWTSWSYEWSVQNKGEYTIIVRATDSHNRTQPETPFWNRKGYGYNATDKIKVKVE